MAVLSRPVTMIMFWMPECNASSTPYWMIGLSTSGSISFGWALVAGRNLVPSPAAGKTALRTLVGINIQFRRRRRAAQHPLEMRPRFPIQQIVHGGRSALTGEAVVRKGVSTSDAL